MTIANSGVLSWTTPTLGTYAVTVTAKDTKTGLIGKGIYTIAVTAQGPTIVATHLPGVAGQALTGAIAFTDSNVLSESPASGTSPSPWGPRCVGAPLSPLLSGRFPAVSVVPPTPVATAAQGAASTGRW